MAPIRALVNSILALQIIGGILGVLILNQSDLLSKLWIGAAFGSFPGYLIGLYIQYRISHGSLSENIIMVRRIGLIALLLFIIASYKYLKGI